jgi:hypothetical protein
LHVDDDVCGVDAASEFTRPVLPVAVITVLATSWSVANQLMLG